MDLQASIITFRETLEALLIVGVIVAYLKRVEHEHWNKWVWVGVALALLASFGVALIFQIVLTGFGTMASQNYLRFSIMFISAGLLTHMVMFLGQQKVNFQESIQSKIHYIVTTGSIVNMLVHTFLVVLREGIETIFFFAAISGGDIGKAITSWGALAGVVVASGIAYYFFKRSRKLPLGVFFRYTAILLMIIAAGLIVQGIGVLQDLKLMGSVYRTPGGEIGEVYNLQWFMPEHPIDEEQYIRDTGETPWVSGDVGIFLKAFLGYSHNPSVEEFVCYWLYFVVVYILLNRKKKKVGQTIKLTEKEQEVG